MVVVCHGPPGESEAIETRILSCTAHGPRSTSFLLLSEDLLFPSPRRRPRIRSAQKWRCKSSRDHRCSLSSDSVIASLRLRRPPPLPNTPPRHYLVFSPLFYGGLYPVRCHRRLSDEHLHIQCLPIHLLVVFSGMLYIYRFVIHCSDDFNIYLPLQLGICLAAVYVVTLI